MARQVLIPCACGKAHRIQDPGRNVRVRCRSSGTELVYECRSGQEYRLRGPSRDILLPWTTCEIGRHLRNDIVLQVPEISRRHCRLAFTDAGHTIEDLGSQAGTFVNEEQLPAHEPQQLAPGDLVRLAHLWFRYVAPEDRSPASGPATVLSEDGDLEAVMQASEASRADEWVGRNIGPYTVLDLLAQGTMGKVYFARHARLKREVVLKTIVPEQTDSEETVKRFLREIQVGASISHPNVITFYDSGQHESLYYIAMEFFPGEDLWKRFYNRPASFRQTVEIGLQAAAALMAAHDQEIVHRDIKPANILLADTGGIKIVDFGVAKARQNPAFSAVTVSGAVIGTPHYMPPEQIEDASRVDRRADVYGLCATLHTCVTGDVPFAGENLVEVAEAVLRGDPVRPSAVRPDLPAELEALLLKGMARDPGGRFQDAAALREALEALSV